MTPSLLLVTFDIVANVERDSDDSYKNPSYC